MMQSRTYRVQWWLEFLLGEKNLLPSAAISNQEREFLMDGLQELPDDKFREVMSMLKCRTDGWEVLAALAEAEKVDLSPVEPEHTGTHEALLSTAATRHKIQKLDLPSEDDEIVETT